MIGPPRFGKEDVDFGCENFKEPTTGPRVVVGVIAPAQKCCGIAEDRYIVQEVYSKSSS
jgi:hypothetical protein